METLRNEINEQYKWNLFDLIKDEEEYELIKAKVKMLANKISGMKNQIVKNASNLYCYLENNVELDKSLEKLYVYAYLYHYQDMLDEKGLKYKTEVDNLVDEISIKLSFINSELMSIDYEQIKTFIDQMPELKKYQFDLEKTYRYKVHLLSENEEKLLAEASLIIGNNNDTYNALNNVDIDLGFIKDEFGKKIKLTQANYINYLQNKDRNVRKSAFKNMYNFYEIHINTIANTYIGKLKESKFLSNVRKFNNSLEQSLFSNKIEESFYHYFIETIHKYIPLFEKYFKLRNKSLGYKMHLYDLFVDLTEKESRKISYEEAQSILIEALKPLGQTYVDDLKKSFKEGWIDVLPNKYKRSGAYQWGTYEVHPYVSLNYTNDYESTSTLAHELGHAMHSFYTNKSQDYIYASYPIFLAEIASIVNEVLINDYFYQKAQTDEEKIIYLQKFLDDVRSTVFRQTMFAEFEQIMHKKIHDNELITAQILNETYYDLNKLYFGKSVNIDDAIKFEWARIPHFYTPFYVYQYATGFIVALSIVSDILNNNENVKERYLEFLKSGCSDYPLEILKNVGIDITDPLVVKKAFDLVELKIKELEELLKKKEMKDE